jgi:hypothetical protein
MHNVTLTRVRVPFLPWKPIIIAYSEGLFVAVGTQHAMHMRLIIFSSGPIRLYHIFPHYLITGSNFEKQVT